MRLFIQIAIILGTSAFIRAQTKIWDLQQCIDYGIKNNLSLKQSELNTYINKNNVIQSKATVLPSFNSGAQHTYNFGRTIDRYTNTFANTQVLSQNFFISSNVVLWSGFAQYNAIKSSNYQYLSSVENYLQQQNDLSLNIATAYINVIFSDEVLQISQAQYQITNEQLERTKKMADAGTLAKSAVYDLKAQLANEEVNVTSSNNNYQLALLTLKQLLNLDTLSQFKILKPDVSISDNTLTTTSVEFIYELALKNQHSIKSSEYNLLAAEKNVAVAKGRVSPTISATGSLGTGTSELNKKIDVINVIGVEQLPYYTSTGQTIFGPKTEVITSKKSFSDQFSENVNKSVGFTLSVPILNGLQTYTALKNAKLSALNAKYSQDLTAQNLYKTIVQAYANAKSAYERYQSNLAAVEASEQSFSFAKQKYNVGAISTFDYNNAKIRFQNAQGNLVQAKYDYVFKLKVLDYYQGKELKL